MPIPGEKGPWGTLWVLSQKESVTFDAEHSRILTSLASFVGVALKVEEARAAAMLRALETQALNEALHSADERKNEFIAMAAHEMRHPLAPIASALQTAQRLVTDVGPLQAAIAIAIRQSSRLTRLVDDLFDATRINNGKLSLRPVHAQLENIVEDALDSVRSDIERLGQSLRVCLPPMPVTVFADAARITQIIANLLSNAVRYTPAGGEIVVTVNAALPVNLVNEEFRDVSITVRDTGIGIPTSVLPHVFEMFAQSPDSPIRSGGGLGIGLAVVKRLVEMHKGTVEVSSAGEGKGTTCMVTLPIACVSTLVNGSAGDVPTVPTLARKVLLVDDDIDSLEALRMLLELDGHEVRVAFSGTAAVEKLDDFTPDVAFIDIHMPGMNGYELTQMLRSRKDLQKTRFIALTGSAKISSSEARAKDGHFQNCCVKPVSAERIATILQSL